MTSQNGEDFLNTPDISVELLFHLEGAWKLSAICPNRSNSGQTEKPVALLGYIKLGGSVENHWLQGAESGRQGITLTRPRTTELKPPEEPVGRAAQ